MELTEITLRSEKTGKKLELGGEFNGKKTMEKLTRERDVSFLKSNGDEEQRDTN